LPISCFHFRGKQTGNLRDNPQTAKSLSVNYSFLSSKLF
jgi:hypothetical protein